jgi:hypothetical protein
LWKWPVEPGASPFAGYQPYVTHAGTPDGIVDGCNWISHEFTADGELLERPIPAGTQLIADWGCIEHGYVRISEGEGVSARMVLYNQPLPEQPSAAHKYGLRLMLLFPPPFGLRVLTTCSKQLVGLLGALLNAFLIAPEAAAGHMTVYQLDPSRRWYSKKYSKHYCAPVIPLVGWTPDRPSELGPRLLAPPDHIERPIQRAISFGSSVFSPAPDRTSPKVQEAPDNLGGDEIRF